MKQKEMHLRGKKSIERAETSVSEKTWKEGKEPESKRKPKKYLPQGQTGRVAIVTDSVIRLVDR